MAKKKEHYDALLVGAGLFNAVLATRLVEQGKKVLVIDRRTHLGGNCHTELRSGILVHKYGAHIFHTSNEKVWEFATRYGKFSNFINSPVANYRGEMYNLPFNMNTFCRLDQTLNTPEKVKSYIDSVTAEWKSRVPSNLEEKAQSLIGPILYEKLVKGYTEKQWGKPCHELPPDIITRLPVRLTFDNNYFNDRYQGIPVTGYTDWIKNMLSGTKVRLGVNYNADRAKWNSMADRVYYSGCVDEYFDYALGKLEYRSLKFKEKTYSTDNLQGNAVINYTDTEPKYTRSIEHRFFMDGCKSKKTIVSYEYPATWKRGMEPYYPVNTEHNQELYGRYRVLFGATNVIPVGRLGMYRYLDMDDTIEAALNLPL